MMAKTWTLRSRLCGLLHRLVLLLALSILGSTSNHARAGVLLDLESVPLGTSLTNGVGIFQHTSRKHRNPDAFLTTQDDNTSNGFVAAFNGASANPAGNPEAIFSGGKTHTIVLGDVPTTTDGLYRVFLFDANQNQSELDDHIDISMLQVFTSASASLTSISQLGPPNANKVYDLDSIQDYTVRVDGSVGSGGADMYFFLPQSIFTAAGATAATNVYLFYEYSNFNDGPDAWLLDKKLPYTNPNVPEPAAMALWAVGGSMGMIWSKRRKRAKSA